MCLYGITLERYREMQEEQLGQCAICGKVSDTLFVDHDHASGQVRGLLCRDCNTGVGMFGDCTSNLERAIDYLLAAQLREVG